MQKKEKQKTSRKIISARGRLKLKQKLCFCTQEGILLYCDAGNAGFLEHFDVGRNGKITVGQTRATLLQ